MCYYNLWKQTDQKRVVWWLSVASQQESPGFESSSAHLTPNWVLGSVPSWCRAFLCGVCMLSPCLLPHAYSGVLLQTKDMQVDCWHQIARRCELLFVSICQTCKELASCPRPVLAGIGSSLPVALQKDKQLQKWMNECWQKAQVWNSSLGEMLVPSTAIKSDFSIFASPP